jgi:hypothetical protein
MKMLKKKFTQKVFDQCVELLVNIGDSIGMSYEEVNIWIFCILWPILTIGMFITILMLL